MKRSELIDVMQEKWDRPERETRQLVDEFFESIARVLDRDGRLELRGFGVFELKERASRPGRIPGTGETVEVPEHVVPDFSPGKDLKESVRELDPDQLEGNSDG